MSTTTHIPTSAPPSPPRGALFSDPTANALFSAFLTLEEGLQHLFHQEVGLRLAIPYDRDSAQETREAQAIAALREGAELLADEARQRGEEATVSDVKLTEREYSRLRVEHPERDWPAASNVRRWLGGSWEGALRRAYLEATDAGDIAWRSSGHAFVWEEVSTAMLDCDEDMRAAGDPDPDPGLDDFLAWAHQPDILRNPKRQPLSQTPFNRFGGYHACRRAALRGDGPPTPDDSWHLRSGFFGRPTPRGPYPDSLLEDAIREASTSLGRVPLAREYTSFREEEFARAAKEGRPRKPLPSYSKIVKRYGSWDAALVAAGLEPFGAPRLDRATGRAVAMGPRNRISDEDLSSSLREAYEELGPPFTVNAYVAWQRRKSGIGKSGRRLASYACVYGRYRGAPEGAWRAACDKALPNGWQGVR